MRRAAKRDDNHTAIVKTLRAWGVLVLDLGAVGNGCPDLLCRTRKAGIRFLEIKDGRKPPSARKLTDPQVEFHALWGTDVYVVKSAAEALEVMGIDTDSGTF